MLKWRRRKWPRLLWLFLFQLTKGRKRPLAVSAQGYNNLQTWYHKLWVLLYYRPTKFTAMAVGAALVEWEELWISLICKLREKNVEGDSQYTVETSRFISQLTRYIVKQRTEFDYYCRSSRVLTTTFMSFHSVVRFLFSILAFLFQFLLPFYSENEVVFCVSAVIPSFVSC